MQDTQTEKSEPTSKEHKWKTTTLGALGGQLPIGVYNPTTQTLDKTLSHKRWNNKIEKRVGTARKRQDGKTDPTGFISSIISLLFTQFGSYALDVDDVTTASSQAKIAMLSNAFVSDILYAWFWLRREVIDSSLEMQLPCRRCRKVLPVTADLDTIKVRTVDSFEDACWEHVLREPLKIRGQEIQRIKFSPPRWSVGAEATGTIEDGKLKVVAAAVHSLPEHPSLVPVESDFDDMGKWDLERIVANFDTYSAGADLAVEVTCNHCFAFQKIPIDWTYDAFFSNSSRQEK